MRALKHNGGTASEIAAYVLEDQARMSRARNYFAWQARLVKPRLGRRVVEAGCGVGNFTAELLDRELVVAVDVDDKCLQTLRARFPGLATFSCDASSPEFRGLARFRPDSCVFLNVLEHIEDDAQALENAAEIVGPGGSVVLLVPAFPALYGPIDRNLGHHRRYRREDVEKLARAAGLRIEDLRYFNFAGFFGWWLNARLFRRETQSAAQIRFFDGFVAPLMRRIEAVVRPPFGQSIFCVLRRG